MTDSFETTQALHEFATDYREQEQEIERLRTSLTATLQILLGHDDRFRVAIGGNPNVVDKMIEDGREMLRVLTSSNQ